MIAQMLELSITGIFCIIVPVIIQTMVITVSTQSIMLTLSLFIVCWLSSLLFLLKFLLLPTLPASRSTLLPALPE